MTTLLTARPRPISELLPPLGEDFLLWHYTGSSHVPGIQRHGIHLVSEMLPGLSDVFRGPSTNLCIWLTESPSWSSQRWATRLNHACDRAEARFPVTIPANCLGRYVVPWQHLASSLLDLEWPDSRVPETIRQMNAPEFGDHDEWWVVHERSIPVEWLGAPEYRP